MAGKTERERLDVLLVERGLCDTRAKAQARVIAGEVVVDDQRVDKPGTKVARAALIRLKGDGLKWVSRGGLKLAGALEQFGVHAQGRVCLDVGASTGGFTDVLLENGALLVHAVDVGRGQLHEKLRQDARVRNLEQTHIVKLPPHALEPLPDLGVVDVSFISLKQVLPAMARQLAAACEVIALVKPQFEVGREHVGKGGIVKDEAARARALDDVAAAAVALGFQERGRMPSPITGTDGNVEFLLYVTRQS
jgi:23S rRNA (cytidine1920-2'-O)/16S rRNA (cytidine1409-2'-O)-methyltransferase